MHEMGHAFYELNIAPEYETTPLAGGVSLGVHESQSRLWENLVGRSREFWNHYYPHLQSAFPSQLAKVGLEEFYRVINHVNAPSLIRVEADEVTYNFHIILRYEMEQALLDRPACCGRCPRGMERKNAELSGHHAPDQSRSESCRISIGRAAGLGYFPTYTPKQCAVARSFSRARKRRCRGCVGR